MLRGEHSAILLTFISIGHHFPLRPLFCLFLSDCLTCLKQSLKKNTKNWFSISIIDYCRSKVLQNDPRGAFCNIFGIIRLPFSIKAFVLSIFKWPLKTGFTVYHNKRFYPEGRIEKSVLRIAVWHHEACRVITNGDSKGRIFSIYPHE